MEGRKRVETRSDAARFLGVSRSRLQEIERDKPGWWSDEFHNEAGYDVVGIAVAQAEFHLQKRLLREQESVEADLFQGIEIRELEAKALISELEVQKRLRVEAEKSGELVSAEIVRGYHAEMLQELRRTIEDLPYAFSRVVPPDFLAMVFVEESEWRGKDVGRAAPLQRLVMSAVERFESWLERISVDIFADDPT